MSHTNLPPCLLPLLSEVSNVSSEEVANVPRTIAGFIANNREVTSQMGLAVGLCNCLSFCLDAMLHQTRTEAEKRAVLTIEEHLDHTVKVLGHIRRNGLKSWLPE